MPRTGHRPCRPPRRCTRFSASPFPDQTPPGGAQRRPYRGIAPARERPSQLGVGQVQGCDHATARTPRPSTATARKLDAPTTASCIGCTIRAAIPARGSFRPPARSREACARIEFNWVFRFSAAHARLESSQRDPIPEVPVPFHFAVVEYGRKKDSAPQAAPGCLEEKARSAFEFGKWKLAGRTHHDLRSGRRRIRTVRPTTPVSPWNRVCQ
jgi:hypothetical protein